MSIFQRTYEDVEREWWRNLNDDRCRREDRKLRLRRLRRRVRRALKKLRGRLS